MKTLKSAILLLLFGGTFSCMAYDYDFRKMGDQPKVLESKSILDRSSKINSLETNYTSQALAPDTYGGGPGNALISLALPGVGLYLNNQNPLAFAFLPICYGLVGSGTFFYLKSKSEYNNYMDAKDPVLQTQYIDSANDKKDLAISLIGAGGAIWIFQVAWTYIYGKYNNIYRDRDSKWKNKGNAFFGGYDPATRTAQLNLRLKI